jgi:ribosome-binding protein aMBF1 (putative translation factor)
MLRRDRMKSLDALVEDLKKNPQFENGFDRGYEDFKIGIVLREARLKAGLTQDEIASRIKTKKSNISRIENHAQDIKLSTLEKFAAAVGKRVEVKIV